MLDDDQMAARVWRLDPWTREIGRRGVAQARETLRRARRPGKAA